MVRVLCFVACLVAITHLFIPFSFAQQQQGPELPEFIEDELEDEEATSSSRVSSPSAEEREKLERLREQDVTQPEEEEQRDEFLALFEARLADELTVTNFMAYGVQYAVRSGVPANTVMLVLLLPFLASVYAFLRHVVGLPSIGMFLPIALSITLVATGIAAGLILFGVILLASTFARLVLKRLRIMYLPKAALHMFLVSVFIIVTLTLSAVGGILAVRQLSIFPVLLLILLSEQIVSIQLERSRRETLFITLVTFFLGLLGWSILSSSVIRNTALLYPEFVLLLIPLNIAVGRYFGLRLLEYFRFSPVRSDAN